MIERKRKFYPNIVNVILVAIRGINTFLTAFRFEYTEKRHICLFSLPRVRVSCSLTSVTTKQAQIRRWAVPSFWSEL